MNWRPHTEHPACAGETVLIAFIDAYEKCPLLLGGIYEWDGAQFVSEDDRIPANPAMAFWWALESDVLEGLPAI